MSAVSWRLIGTPNREPLHCYAVGVRTAAMAVLDPADMRWAGDFLSGRGTFDTRWPNACASGTEPSAATEAKSSGICTENSQAVAADSPAVRAVGPLRIFIGRGEVMRLATTRSKTFVGMVLVQGYPMARPPTIPTRATTPRPMRRNRPNRLVENVVDTRKTSSRRLLSTHRALTKGSARHEDPLIDGFAACSVVSWFPQG